MNHDEMIEEIHQDTKDLKKEMELIRRGMSNLYGDPELPGQVGDIPEIKQHLAGINGFKGECLTRLSSAENKIRLIIYALAGSGILAGTGLGIKDLLH